MSAVSGGGVFAAELKLLANGGVGSGIWNAGRLKAGPPGVLPLRYVSNLCIFLSIESTCLPQP